MPREHLSASPPGLHLALAAGSSGTGGRGRFYREKPRSGPARTPLGASRAVPPFVAQGEAPCVPLWVVFIPAPRMPSPTPHPGCPHCTRARSPVCQSLGSRLGLRPNSAVTLQGGP